MEMKICDFILLHSFLFPYLPGQVRKHDIYSFPYPIFLIMMTTDDDKKQ